jgi:para-aminobenzoate synthetase/4-amino-4-deoxychorismate lyase
MSAFDPAILDDPGAVFMDDRDIEHRTGKSYVFTEPSDVISARSPDEVSGALQRLDNCLNAGMYAAGYLGYEAGLVLDKPISSRHSTSLPLIWLGVYTRCLELDSEQVRLGEIGAAGDVRGIELNLTADDYLEHVRRIKEYIAAGDVYQVNYTCKLLFENMKSARSLFARLRRAHPVGYSAFINMGDTQVVSLSPELFLQRKGKQMLARPMKGTMRRGRWLDEDLEMASLLAADEKNRAENVMIVDLMRNDLGRICAGVNVPRMFHVERYETLFQMTSDVAGRLKDGITTADIMQAVFPPGSVTGAPKIRAMEIINEIEQDARGVYCGCIGMFRPGGDFLLNVAIRTIVQQDHRCEMGIGGGIVADSTPQDELQEALLKGKFLQAEPVSFRLLETMLYRRGFGYAFLSEHLARMRQSAEYFGRRFPEADLVNLLDKIGVEIEASHDRLTKDDARVRLRLDSGGKCSAEWSDAGPPLSGPVNLCIASRRTDPADIFLYHKTTHRSARDADLREARRSGYFDVLYLNVQDQVTEGAVTSLVAEIEGHSFTPPVECGLLPGIWRRSLLAEGKVMERILTVEDIRRATRIWVGNSVRGPVKVSLIRSSDGSPIYRDPGVYPQDESGNTEEDGFSSFAQQLWRCCIMN